MGLNSSQWPEPYSPDSMWTWWLGLWWPPWTTERPMGSKPQTRRSLEAYTEEPTALPVSLYMNVYE